MTPAEASQLRFMDPERVAAQAQAFAEALGRLGEPITEAQGREIAARHQCECQEGMFALAPTRRGLLGSAGLIAAVGVLSWVYAPPLSRFGSMRLSSARDNAGGLSRFSEKADPFRSPTCLARARAKSRLPNGARGRVT